MQNYSNKRPSQGSAPDLKRIKKTSKLKSALITVKRRKFCVLSQCIGADRVSSKMGEQPPPSPDKKKKTSLPPI